MLWSLGEIRNSYSGILLFKLFKHFNIKAKVLWNCYYTYSNWNTDETIVMLYFLGNRCVEIHTAESFCLTVQTCLPSNTKLLNHPIPQNITSTKNAIYSSTLSYRICDICSDTSPIMKIIIELDSRSADILVNRFCVMKVNK